ncbi:MAG: DsrE/DsrF/DrsH-like family protein [Acidobacteria bacterium]|jgi:peroxiredoxin family protein|nr:DsrE/DsrF/DrsH-like family protein [Acidobacteriota bacterium]
MELISPNRAVSGDAAASLQKRLDELEERVNVLAANSAEDNLSMVVMSGDLDHILAAFVIATGASAMYEKVTMFFTFWSIQALRDPKKSPPRKDFVGRLFSWMLPKGAPGLKLSKMNMGGLGTGMLKRLMKKNNVLGLEELLRRSADAGVQIYICQMSMDLMGLKLEEMIDYPDLKLAGVATFLAEAGTSKVSLFI